METREWIPKQTQASHPFLLYAPAQGHWLFHPKAFGPAKVTGYILWQDLMDGEIKAIELPWYPKKRHDFGDKKHEMEITERALGSHQPNSW